MLKHFNTVNIVCITDFGIAKQMEGIEVNATTIAGTLGICL